MSKSTKTITYVSTATTGWLQIQELSIKKKVFCKNQLVTQNSKYRVLVYFIIILNCVLYTLLFVNFILSLGIYMHTFPVFGEPSLLKQQHCKPLMPPIIKASE